jgi:hypothetical protein
MMHFRDPRADAGMLAELKEEGILTPDVIARTDAAMGHPESGTLNDFLLAAAVLIPEETWLAWLIRRHGCHRFGRVAWRDEAAPWAIPGAPPDGNLPWRRCADGAILVAVLRPDLLAAARSRLAPCRVHSAAATLNEMKLLFAAWTRA